MTAPSLAFNFACAIDTPDAAYDVLKAAGLVPSVRGWRDPLDGEGAAPVRWQEAMRRARRRAR